MVRNLLNGKWVKVNGLKSEAGQKLNGKVGQILKESSDDSRHAVQIDEISAGKLIKKENLEDIAEKDMVRTCRLSCDGENIPKVSVILFPKDHSMFHKRRGNAPALDLCGIPLVIEKVNPVKPLSDRWEFDNQWTTYMMIEPRSGFAPFEWQAFIGPVLVYRPGGLDFGVNDMVAVNEFTDQLLDLYPTDSAVDPMSWLNPSFFQEFLKRNRFNREDFGTNLLTV